MPSSGSLRLKLTVWFVLVFVLIQAGLLGGVVYFRRELNRRSQDDALMRSAEAMVDNVLAAEVEWNVDRVAPLVPEGAGFRLFAIRDEAGEPLLAWKVDGRALPFSAWEVVPAGPIGGVHTSIAPERARELIGSEQRLRMVTLPIRHRDQVYYFQAAVDDEAFERLLGPFLDLIVLGMPVGVVAALIAAWFIGGRAVSPIRMLSSAARDVSPTSLGERFRVSSSDSEVARLESELNSALERLEAGYEAQAQFIGNVSHELRTPIAVLLTQAQVARMGTPDLEKGYAFVDLAERLLKRLGKLVESFLVLARADHGGVLPSEGVAAIDVVLGCVQTCDLVARQAGVRLVPNLAAGVDELVVRGDQELLQTMLENLVLNAISHSPPAGEVAIDVELARDELSLSVCDEGPGIPEGYLPHVFDRFVRIPESSARRDGSGLGLSIAAGVARLHGGTIEVRNRERAGCCFRVRLPAQPSGDVADRA